jgi:uncharacterized membrane protein (UPF0182 family)
MRRSRRRPALERGNRALAWLIGGTIAFFLLLKLLSLWAEGLWFASEGYGQVFVRLLWWRGLLFVLCGAWFFALVYVPYALAKKAAAKVPMPLRAKLFDDMDKALVDATIDRWALWLSLLFATIAGLIASGRWNYLVLFLYGEPFGVTDPVFGKDVGFYVFRLPLLKFLASLSALGLFLGLSGLVLRLRYEELLRFEENGVEAPPFAARPLLGVLAAFLLTLAVGQFLGRYGVLLSKRGVVFGAGFSDVYGTLPGYWLLILVTVASALACLVAMRGGDLRPVRWGIVAILGAWVGGRWLLPTALQSFLVVPNERVMERPYLRHNIQMTRFAYRLDEIKERPHPGNPAPTVEELRQHFSVLENVRLWDIEPLLDYLNQTQALRGYYGFSSVDYDRYLVNGRLRQVAIGTRELFLPPPLRRWVNERLRYTHGYGVVVLPVNEFTGEGAPRYFIKDIPPEIAPSFPFKLRRPQIYFGEFVFPEERLQRQPFARRLPPQRAMAPSNPTTVPTGQPPSAPSLAPMAPEGTPQTENTAPPESAPTRFVPVADYVLVRTSEPEFDYPLEGAQRWKTTTYEADAGVPIGSWWRRVLFAARFMDLNLLLTNAIRPETRLLMYRQVLERVQAVAPFLLVDPDPYPVITPEGNILWLVDAYTATSQFPYSEPLSPFLPLNYLRNAVKVTVDAYTGRMTFYAFDERDPLLRAYQRAFPTLLQPRKAMPDVLKAHIRYPRLLFTIQAQLLCRYHMTDPDQFYQNEDRWDIAREQRVTMAGTEQTLPMRPYYIVLRSPDDGKDRFLLLLPFTPFGLERRNMIALMVAHCDADRYGELLIYRFPSGQFVEGPQLVDARINAHPVISQQLSLWNQAGSRVLWGSMFVAPVGSSLLFVKPLYLQAEQTRLPELKRVVVATGKGVAIGTDLWDALRQLFPMPFGDHTQQVASPASTPSSTTDNEIVKALLRAEEARRKGDWAGYEKFYRQALELARKKSAR